MPFKNKKKKCVSISEGLMLKRSVWMLELNSTHMGTLVIIMFTTD